MVENESSSFSKTSESKVLKKIEIKNVGYKLHGKPNPPKFASKSSQTDSDFWKAIFPTIQLWILLKFDTHLKLFFVSKTHDAFQNFVK